MRRALWIAALLALPARLVHAQPAAASERVWISVSGGAQAGPTGFGDAVDIPLYQENKTVTTTYPRGGGAAVWGGGGVRIWKQLSAGVGISRVARTTDAHVSASLPHPFFDHQPRQVEGTTPSTREEVGVQMKIAWTLALPARLRLIVAGGPCAIAVTQTLVTDVTFAESYPYDTAAFTRAVTSAAAKTGTGGHASADLFWLISRHLGAGGAIQFARARLTLTSGTRRVAVDAGGVQAGAGLRVVF